MAPRGLAAVSISLGRIAVVLQLGMIAYWAAVLLGVQWLGHFAVLALLVQFPVLGIAAVFATAGILVAVIALVRARRSPGADSTGAKQGLVVGVVGAAILAAQLLYFFVDWHPETLNP
jgi:hypothetical protein